MSCSFLQNSAITLQKNQTYAARRVLPKDVFLLLLKLYIELLCCSPRVAIKTPLG